MHVSPLPPDDVSCTLSASVDGAPVAELRLHVLGPSLLLARLRVETGTDSQAVARAFARTVTERWGRGGVEVLVEEKPSAAAWLEALEWTGWAVVRRKAFVARGLEDELPAAPTELRFTSLAEAGEPEFIARLTMASEGDAFQEDGPDPQREWQELVQYAGDRFAPADWFLVDDDHGAVGILLPQAYDDSEGSIFYLGVVPSRRRQGLGRALHAAGLHELARRGLTRYVGSTDLRNTAMRLVFERNGCPVEMRQLFLQYEASSTRPTPKQDRHS